MQWPILFDKGSAAAKLRGTEENADVGVSVDGTWQRKGFSSTLGVVKAISIDSGKVLDVAIFFKSYKGCTSMRHGTYLIIVILMIPALPLEWKQQELVRYLAHQKRSMDYITPFLWRWSQQSISCCQRYIWSN